RIHNFLSRRLLPVFHTLVPLPELYAPDCELYFLWMVGCSLPIFGCAFDHRGFLGRTYDRKWPIAFQAMASASGFSNNLSGSLSRLEPNRAVAAARRGSCLRLAS